MSRSGALEPFLRGCAWPAAEGIPYPRCDPGPQGQRLPADTRAAAAQPVGVRLQFSGEPEAIEIDWCPPRSCPTASIPTTPATR